MITLVLILSASYSIPASADDTNTNGTTTIEYLDNGDYIETTIIILESTRGPITGTKTATDKNSSNEVLWDVSVTGTFVYSGSDCTCANATGSSHSYSSNWTVSLPSISRSGNTATSSATGKRHLFGIVVQTEHLAVTLFNKSSDSLSSSRKLSYQQQ